MDQPHQLPSPSRATFGSESAIEEEDRDADGDGDGDDEAFDDDEAYDNGDVGLDYLQVRRSLAGSGEGRPRAGLTSVSGVVDVGLEFVLAVRKWCWRHRCSGTIRGRIWDLESIFGSQNPGTRDMLEAPAVVCCTAKCGHEPSHFDFFVRKFVRESFLFLWAGADGFVHRLESSMHNVWHQCEHANQ